MFRLAARMTAAGVASVGFGGAGRRQCFSSSGIGIAQESAREALRAADAVCFDVDSTVISEEGIDMLAGFVGQGNEVAEWTAKAMGGGVKFEDALKARLDIIEPGIEDIRGCLAEDPPRLNPGVEELIKLLHERGTDVYLISGGFRLVSPPRTTY